MTITLTATRDLAAHPGTHGGFADSSVNFSLTRGQTAGFV